MKIQIASIYVRDQDEALEFYTQFLGFIKKTEIPLGEFKMADLHFARRTGRP